jgi:hypothetical protein
MAKLKILIVVGQELFEATLNDHPAALKFYDSLPLTLAMKDLNANEKYARLPFAINGKETNPGFIHAGDLMIWSNHTLVLFYKSFKTEYPYIALGKIDHPANLAKVPGSSTVSVKFEKN